MASKSSPASSTQPSAGGTRITWDEETIQEHNKLRGTRCKIVEANTPYIVYDQDGDTAVERSRQVAGETLSSASALAQAKQAEKATALPPSGRSGSPVGGGRGALNVDELQRKLEAHASGKVPTFAASFESDTMTDSPNPRRQSDRKAFLNKRKNHYNEFKMAKLLASQIMDEDDEDEDEGSSSRNRSSSARK